MEITNFKYDWELKNGFPVKKNNYKVFSCFSCGGGSTMGYKLAGFNVIGFNEIDKKLAKVYIENFNPKYQFIESIQDFKNRKDFPKDLYNLDILDSSPPCFTKNTLVMCEDGFKKIKDIKINDKVFTHKNRLKTISETMNKRVSEIVNLKIQGCLNIETTKEHPFYVRTMNRQNKFNIRKFSKPCWKTVDELNIIKNSSNSIKEQDYIGIPINLESQFPNWEGVLKNNIKECNLDLKNKNLWYLIGRWFGDGWIRIFENNNKHKYQQRYNSKQETCLNCNNLSKRHERYENQWTSYCSEKCRKSYGRKIRKPNRHVFIICCGKHEVEQLKNKIEKYTSKYILTEERTVYKFHISSKELCYYMKQFGSGAKNKKITSDIFNLPIEYLSIFLDGYLDADGHIDKKGKFICSSISEKLIYEIQSIVYKVYKVPTTLIFRKGGDGIIEGRKVNVSNSYSLQFYKTYRVQQHGFYEDNYIWLPFRKKTIMYKNTIVYNLSVEDDESYTVYNFACHNCSSFSIAGLREKAWGKEKKFREGQTKQILDTLFFDLIDLAKELQPKIVIAENVKGLLLGKAKNYLSKIIIELQKAGYSFCYKLLDSSKMGVPQKRERVFIFGVRNDLLKYIKTNTFFHNRPILNLDFNIPEIPFKDVSDNSDQKYNLTELTNKYWENAKESEQVGKFCSIRKTNMKKPSHTICASRRGFAYHPIYKRALNKNELIKIGTFPSDYNFLNVPFYYIIGMSVPPVMMAHISNEVKNQWLDKINKGIKDGKN